MNTQDVKLGQKVKCVRANLFYHFNVDKVGIVTLIDEEHITVRFEDGDEDYGYATSLELVEDVATAKPVAANVKQAIADVEAALAVLKGLVG